MQRVWIILTALLSGIQPAKAQIFSPLDRTFADKHRVELARRLAVATPGSQKLQLLLDISNAWLRIGTPDSALLFSGQAVQLAGSLGMQEAEQQARFLACRGQAMKNNIPAADAIATKTTGIWQMRMLQEISEHYSFRPGNLPANLDSAWPYIRRLVALTDTLHSRNATLNTRAVLGKYYYQRGDLHKGMGFFRENIRQAHNTGDKELEAHWWSELATYTPAYAATIDTILQAATKARDLFEVAGNRKEALFIASDIAEWHWLMGRPLLAAQEARQVNDQLLRLGQARMYGQYRKLANYELCLGNHNMAMCLTLQARRNMDSLEEDFDAGRVDKCLANIFWVENDIDTSLMGYRLVLREAQGRRDLIVYGPALHIVEGLIRKADTTGARQFLTAFVRDNPPVRSRDKELIAAAWGDIFAALGQHRQAELSYLRMMRFNSLALEESKRDIEQYYDYDLARTSSNYTLGKFYVDQHRFSRARPFLLAALAPHDLTPHPVDVQRDVHFLLFKVDSASGDLASAITHRLLYEKYADSIFNAKKARELAQVQIQYETDRRDKDIALLSKQTQLQKAELSRSNLLRNIVLGGLGLTLLISAFLFDQYRLKQRNNRTLQQLVTEKEILLREIHHRVKNNLQTIVSLLSTRCGYLSREALQAIQEIRNRVFSISLIHQKLYQGENVAFMRMSAYLPELVNYLRDIYDVGNQISFRLDIADVEVGISQSVSIGLILNEALTNAIKHAFPEKGRHNTVVVEMVATDQNIIHLKIADNGVGLPKQPNHPGSGSLGLKLMKGLTADLGGAFSIESQNGTTVWIRFVANAPFETACKIIASEPSISHV
jgi:two-component sensor histidine kinase